MTGPPLIDPEAFRASGHRVIEVVADYLAAVVRRELPVLPRRGPSDTLTAWPGGFPDDPTPDGDLPALLGRVLAESQHVHHPRYVGHQVATPLPEAALADLVSAILNNGMAIYEMGPVGMATERAVVRWMTSQLRLGPDADGVITSGGSAGNLTALLAARQARAVNDAWAEGAWGGPPLAALVPETAHYSVLRAVQIMGWGKGGAIPVPVDASYRLRPDALPDALRAAERAGRRVVAVVASAGSTTTGAYDPLAPTADFCAEHGLWLHVDGAHGASAVLSPSHRGLLAGIERADSVVWDAHKMLMMPALVTGVLFRDGRRSHEAFAQEASYLFAEGEEQTDSWDLGRRTLECTKRLAALGLYATLALRGTRTLGDYVAAVYDRAARFAARIAGSPDLELATPPQANIVCFRHVPAHVAPAARDAHQARVRERLVADGSFYVVQARLRDGVYLRTTIVNPATSDEDLAALLDAVRDAGGR